MVRGSAEVIAAPTSRVAPEFTVVPWAAPEAPNDATSVILMVPAEMVVVPV